jgi:hypothetical protein
MLFETGFAIGYYNWKSKWLIKVIQIVLKRNFTKLWKRFTINAKKFLNELVWSGRWNQSLQLEVKMAKLLHLHISKIKISPKIWLPAYDVCRKDHLQAYVKYDFLWIHMDENQNYWMSFSGSIECRISKPCNRLGWYEGTGGRVDGRRLTAREDFVSLIRKERLMCRVRDLSSHSRTASTLTEVAQNNLYWKER